MIQQFRTIKEKDIQISHIKFQIKLYRKQLNATGYNRDLNFLCI